MSIHHSLTRPNSRKFVVLAMSLVALATLSACGKKDEGKTVGQKLDSAVASTEQAAARPKQKPKYPWQKRATP